MTSKKAKMSEQHAITYYVDTPKGKVPISSLDSVLTRDAASVQCVFYSPFTGELIDSPDDMTKLHEYVIEVIAQQRYDYTDHLFTCVITGQRRTGYVSLDNSVRANQHGRALKNRLDTLLPAVERFAKNLGPGAVIFFSEACRPSFDGGDINNRLNEVTWETIKLRIEEACQMKWLGDSTSNDGVMSFGLSAFRVNGDHSDLILIPRRILNEGFGSAALGVCFSNQEVIWAIHFPLDFKQEGQSNMGYKTMVSLCELMQTTPNSICAFGDFNKIPGKIANCIVDAANLYDYQFIVDDQNLTFYGAYYDVVEPRPNEKWIEFSFQQFQ